MNYTNDNEFPGGSYDLRRTVANIADTHYNKVLGRLKKLTEGDEALALDLTQNVFLRLLTLGYCDGVARLWAIPNLDAFLYRSAYLQFVTYYRNSGRKCYARAISDEILKAFIDEKNDPLDDSTSREIELIVREEIEKLDEIFKEVCILKYVHGLDIGEIASKLGKPKGTVCSRLITAMAKLRKPLQRRLFNPDD